MNKVIIMGRLVADPVQTTITTAKGDMNVTDFTVAVKRRFTDDGADFIDCSAFRTTSDFIAKHFVKGQPILVEGALYTNTYEDKDGNKRKGVKVNVENVEFAGNAIGKDEAVSNNETVMPDVNVDTGDDELPF